MLIGEREKERVKETSSHQQTNHKVKNHPHFIFHSLFGPNFFYLFWVYNIFLILLKLIHVLYIQLKPFNFFLNTKLVI